VLVQASDPAAVRERCAQTLAAGWREGVRRADAVAYGYTRPSPSHYPFQWYWDSCFAAIVWRHLDPARARRELESLLAAARPDGFIGHTIFWDTPLNARQRLAYNITSADAPMTASIQPPLLAWAWLIVAGDPAEVPAIGRHVDWLAANRDLDGDGLVWIVQADESGLDASPQFDGIWGDGASGTLRFVRLVRRNRRLGYDLRRILAAGGPVCCEVVTNVFYALSLAALGRPSLTPALVDRLYDEDAGLFRPLARPRAPRSTPLTWAALAPIALPDLPDEIGHRLARRLLDSEQFWLPFPPSSVAACDPAFSARDGRFVRHYWRGPTWVNAAWLLWLGLLRLGYRAEADHLRDRIAAAVTASGLREYYDPYSGAGMGAHDFAWSTLVLDMLVADPRAAGAYL
jgi:hypothetical protein